MQCVSGIYPDDTINDGAIFDFESRDAPRYSTTEVCNKMHTHQEHPTVACLCTMTQKDNTDKYVCKMAQDEGKYRP